MVRSAPIFLRFPEIGGEQQTELRWLEQEFAAQILDRNREVGAIEEVNEDRNHEPNASRRQGCGSAGRGCCTNAHSTAAMWVVTSMRAHDVDRTFTSA